MLLRLKDIFNKKREREKEYSYDRCTNPVYFSIPLFIIHLSAIEKLICHTEIIYIYLSAIETLIGHREIKVYFLQFCINQDKWFSKHTIELIVTLSSTNAIKTELPTLIM